MAKELSLWTFGHRGIVRAVDFTYRRLPNPPPCSSDVPPPETFAAVNETNPDVIVINEFLVSAVILNRPISLCHFCSRHR